MTRPLAERLSLALPGVDLGGPNPKRVGGGRKGLARHLDVFDGQERIGPGSDGDTVLAPVVHIDQGDPRRSAGCPRKRGV